VRAFGPALLQVAHHADAHAGRLGELPLSESGLAAERADKLACVITAVLTHGLTLSADFGTSAEISVPPAEVWQLTGSALTSSFTGRCGAPATGID